MAWSLAVPFTRAGNICSDVRPVGLTLRFKPLPHARNALVDPDFRRPIEVRARFRHVEHDGTHVEWPRRQRSHLDWLAGDLLDYSAHFVERSAGAAPRIENAANVADDRSRRQFDKIVDIKIVADMAAITPDIERLPAAQAIGEQVSGNFQNTRPAALHGAPWRTRR